MALQGSLAPAQEAGLPPQPRLALAAAGGALALLWGAKATAPVPLVGPLALSLAAFAQLWFPVARCDRAGLGLAAVGLGRAPGAPPLRRQAVEALACLGIVLPLYALATAALFSGLAADAWPDALPPWAAAARWRLAPPAWALSPASIVHAAGAVLGQVLGVALPEETFYRGYLGPQLARRWPPGGAWAGAMGPAAAATALCFALGHWLGEWHPGRLLTFFPGLLFGALARRHKGVLGAIAVHAACNLFAEAWGHMWVRAA